MDYDDAYSNGAYIKDADTYPPKWEDAAHEWRSIEAAVGRARLNLPYGTSEREAFDLFYPASGKPKGLMVFVHGGYWLAFDNKSWSHLSAGATDRGWAVAIPSYTLAPDARISQITRQIARAINAAAKAITGPIVLTGHSAGGHLVARMRSSDVALTVADRLQNIVPISPLSDLRPLLHTQMNNDLKLDMAEAITESPLLAKSLRPVPTHVWVGANERPAFLDQARWLADGWDNTSLTIAPNRHHFDVIDDLADEDSALMAALLG
ncbi:MAG: alpha/beta hydrolase [Marinosulfonomonas sp.]|nr:alpha/beta hydrolase [Marinosulfonomonas sp.]